MAGKGKAQIEPVKHHSREDGRADGGCAGEAQITAVPGPEDLLSEAEEGLRPSKPGRLRWIKRFVRLVMVLSLLAAGAVYFGIGTRMDAPDWMRHRVEARLERNLGGLQIDFGHIHVVVNHGWRPRIGLRDVTLTRSDGTPVAALADAEISLAMRPLLQGKIQPKKIWLSGLYASLRRGADGNFELSFSEAGSPLRRASDLPQLIEHWDTQLEQPNLAALTEVTTEALTLRYEDGRVNRVWTLDGGTMRLTRAGKSLEVSGGFSLLSGRQYVGGIEANYKSDIGDASAEFGVLISEIASEDIALQAPALGWLQALRAPISGSLRGGIGSDGALLDLSASLQIGEGVIQPTAQTRPVPIESAHSYFTYFPSEQALDFDELRVNSGWVSGTMEGRANLSGIENGRLTELVGQLRFSDLKLNPEALYETPLELAGIGVDFHMEPDPFRLRLGEVLIRDEDTNMRLDGAVETGPEGWEYALNGHVDQVSVDRIKALWPSAAPPKPRKWVQDNLFSGTATDANFAIRGQGLERPLIYLETAFEGVEARFQRHMPNLRDAAGHFSLNGSRLVVMASAGTVTADEGGMIDVTGSSFIIPDTRIKIDTPGAARIMARGPVTAALSLLERAPLSVMSKAGLPVALAEGRMAVTGSLSLPLRKGVKPSEITYQYQGEVTDVITEKLIPGHSLSAQRLRLSGDQSHVQLSGAAQLSGVPLEGTWRQEIGPGADPTGTVSGEVTLSQQVLDSFNIGLPSGLVSGEGRGRYDLRLTRGVPPELSLTSALEGIGLQIPSLGWRKPRQDSGLLDLVVTLRAQPSVDRLRIDAAGLKAEGRVTTSADGGLARATFEDVSLGGWFQGNVVFTGRKDASPAMLVSGGMIDMRRAPFGDESTTSSTNAGTDGGIGPITTRLDRLQVTDSIALRDFNGAFVTSGGFRGEFAARLNGQTTLTGILLPKNGGTATRIKSDDAGGIFRSAGVLRHGQGGSFDMTLLPTATPGEYDGHMTLRNTRIKDAPSMAALINALSLVGLVDELSGQGILFSEVDAGFRLGSTHLIVHESSAIGPSIGLSMDGHYNLSTSALDMRGVLSPIYMVNAIGSLLTRKGEGLIGFAFRLRGTADDPKVQVNPLSGLAPGMLRELFRGPAPRLPEQGAGANVPNETSSEPRKKTSSPFVLKGGDR